MGFAEFFIEVLEYGQIRIGSGLVHDFKRTIGA